MPVLMESAFTFPLAKDAKTEEVCQVCGWKSAIFGLKVELKNGKVLAQLFDLIQ